MSQQIPVTVLTGYLGAGKTTLLNRILTEDHGKKYALIINEFGEVGIDNELVVGADEEIFEMNNGCICCTVRGDLIRIIGGLMKRADQLDGMIIETTGLADPAPVAQTFFTDDEVKTRTKLDAIVTVVDARFFLDRLGDSHEAEEQVAFADVILLNKTDLVSGEELEKVERRIREINPYAKLHKTQRSGVNLDAILDKGAFDLSRILAIEPDFLEHGHEHEHEEDIRSVSAVVEGPIDPEKFRAWIGGVLQSQGQNILRSKGVLAVEGAEQRFVFQAVHMIADSTWGQKWRDGEKRASKLVFIGRKLETDALKAGFEACKAA
ncbi:MAG: CobW family GTP-binding protein [Tagaea sp.]